MDAELREWLGIAPADFPVYLAVIFLVAAFFVGAGVLDTILVSTSLLACVLSCIIGMRKDIRVSGFTNGVKLASYPICLVVCIVVSFLNFKYWN